MSATRPTLAEIAAGPATMSVSEASEAFGFSPSHGYALVRRDEFPARVILAGTRRVVVTASVVAALSPDESTAA